MDADTGISGMVAAVAIITVTVAMKVMRMTRDVRRAIDSDIVDDHVLVHHHRHTVQNVPQTPA